MLRESSLQGPGEHEGPLTQSHENFPVWVRYESEVGHIDLRMAVETWQITHGIVT